MTAAAEIVKKKNSGAAGVLKLEDGLFAKGLVCNC